MDAALFSNTPTTAYLNMPIIRFYEVWQAICAVANRRSKARTEQTQKRAPKSKKAKRKRKR